MLDLQPFRQFADGHVIAARKTLYRQQRLMLLWRQPDPLGRFLAEMQKSPQMIAERCQCFVFVL